ncbi:MAG TPA: phosphoadenylyl-sulfate reductase [Opitutaceae bacterium]|jgi:phosphoadenosine phosphosulfate reductase
MATAATESTAALAAVNERLAGKSAEERVAWAVSEYPGSMVLSTSFGAQAAVMLGLATRVWPEIPVIFIDTGYLFPETYRFADELTSRLKLNLQVYRPEISPAWLEARKGRIWEQGAEGITAYNKLMKVEPMVRAMRALNPKAWMAGLRRSQSSSRQGLPFVGLQDGRAKVLPILDWTDRDVYRYLESRGLPYHPLWELGYVSIGDMHTSRPLSGELTAEQTRFFGLKRECGIHESMDGSNI